MTRRGLGVDPDELASCVSCGLCLPHCPTFRVTGDEALSPRGRIAVMRALDAGAPVDASARRSLDTCVQCRGCETACPSAVPFGHLMEGTRVTLAARGELTPPRWERLGLGALRAHRLVLAASSVAAAAQRVGLRPPRRWGIPRRLPLRRPRLAASGSDVWVHTGCVMDAWQRDVHLAVARLVESTGRGVAFGGAGGACCGALSAHAGLAGQAAAYARRTMAAYPGSAPIVVDSAGCGAMLRDYGRLLGTTAAAAFAERVVDVHEWLANHLDELPAAGTPVVGRVAIQDPCHLRHVQRAHGAVRVVLSRYAPDVVELDDDGLCCGAGGAYAVTHPELAADIRRRKVAAIERSGAALVASANPGCSVHLAAAAELRHTEIVHPAVLAARSAGLVPGHGAGRPERV